MDTNLGQNFQTKLAARLYGDRGPRPDLYIGQYRMAGSDMATVAIGYSREIGPPNPEDLSSFIIRVSKGKLRPHAATIRRAEIQGTTTINVSYQRQFAAFSTMKQELAALGGNRYLRHANGVDEIWELEQNEGVPTVYRSAEENLEELLGQLTSVLQRGNNARVAHTDNQGVTAPPIGAQVRFFDASGQSRIATIMGEPDSRGFYPIKCVQKGGPKQMHQNAVQEVFRTAETDAATQDKLQSYFAEAFGDADFAEDLVREASVTGSEEQFVAFMTTAGFHDLNAALIEATECRRNEGRVRPIGPKNSPEMILAVYEGGSFSWEVDTKAAVKALQAGQNRIDANHGTTRQASTDVMNYEQFMESQKLDEKSPKSGPAWLNYVKSLSKPLLTQAIKNATYGFFPRNFPRGVPYPKELAECLVETDSRESFTDITNSFYVKGMKLDPGALAVFIADAKKDFSDNTLLSIAASFTTGTGKASKSIGKTLGEILLAMPKSKAASLQDYISDYGGDSENVDVIFKNMGIRWDSGAQTFVKA